MPASVRPSCLSFHCLRKLYGALVVKCRPLIFIERPHDRVFVAMMKNRMFFVSRAGDVPGLVGLAGCLGCP